jgi:hypothetical protein
MVQINFRNAEPKFRDFKAFVHFCVTNLPLQQHQHFNQALWAVLNI